MDIQSALKALINNRRLTYDEVGCRLGGIGRQAISGQLNRDSDLTMGRVLKYLDILDCELVIRSRDSAERIEWVLTGAKRAKRGA